MDKVTSVLAALDAGKLPSTEQLCSFIVWVDETIIPRIEVGVTTHLTPRGTLLAQRLRQALLAYKQLLLNKDGDNLLQEALWHLTQGEVSPVGVNTEVVSQDIRTLRSAVRALISIAWSSISSESSTLMEEFASFTRLSLADAAELIEKSAHQAKESLREIEQGVQEGHRTAITGREKARVEAEEQDVKVKWEHGVEAMKSAGDTVIDTSRTVATTVQETKEKTTSRAREAYLKICERAQSDPAYRDAIESLLSVLEKLTHRALDTTSPDTLASLFEDTSPDQHLKQALNDFQTIFERLCSYPLSRVINKVCVCLDTISRDSQLRQWFDEFFALAKGNLTDSGFAQNDESKKKRNELREKWNILMDKEDGKWAKCVDGVKAEMARIQEGLAKDKDLQRLKTAHTQLTQDLEKGLVDVSLKAESGFEALVERATWFWQDLFKVYIPSFLSTLSHVPIPRTEYKNSEIEFVLENLDISSLNVLPSHVYIRNITDIDITTSSTATGGAKTAVGTLTRIKIDAVQLTLRDVSFWYKDLNASLISPSEFSGILALSLPPQGISLELKLRLIPATLPSSSAVSRESLGHFHVIEHVAVSISEDVKLEVRESNHGVLLAMFKPIFMMRLREALEKTLTQQVRTLLEWSDGIAWDVYKRKEVLEDTGTVSGGAALLAAVWSEVGRFRRERRRRGAEVAVRATGTGLVVEQKDPDRGDMQFALGAEPQILSGQKRGPLGTGSEPLARRIVDSVQEATGVDIREVVEEGNDVRQAAAQAKEQVKGTARCAQSFQTRIEQKKTEEIKKAGWRSEYFDF